MGKKYDDFFRKNANIKGKSWKKGEKGKFSLYLGEKYHLGKKRVEQKYPIFGKYNPGEALKMIT